MGIARRLPFSMAFFGIVLALQVVSLDASVHATLLRHLGLNWPALTGLRLHRLVTSPLIQQRPGLVPTVTAFVAATLPLLEWRAGTAAAVVTFFAGDWLSTVPVLVFLRMVDWLGTETHGLLTQLDSGSSSGAFAAAAAVCVTFGGWRRLVLAVSLGGFLAVRILWAGALFDYQHAGAAGAGAAIALSWQWARTSSRSSETRPAPSPAPARRSPDQP